MGIFDFAFIIILILTSGFLLSLIIFKKKYFDGFSRILVYILCILCCILCLVYAAYCSYFTPLLDKANDIELSERINELSNNLYDSANELSKIQIELKERIAYVEELKEQAEIAENTINLTDEQVKAIQQQLNEGGKVSTLYSVVASFIISAFFFVIGIIIGRKN